MYYYIFIEVVINKMHLDGKGKIFKNPINCSVIIYRNQDVKGFFTGYFGKTNPK